MNGHRMGEIAAADRDARGKRPANPLRARARLSIARRAAVTDDPA